MRPKLITKLTIDKMAELAASAEVYMEEGMNPKDAWVKSAMEHNPVEGVLRSAIQGWNAANFLSHFNTKKATLERAAPILVVDAEDVIAAWKKQKEVKQAEANQVWEGYYTRPDIKIIPTRIKKKAEKILEAENKRKIHKQMVRWQENTKRELKVAEKKLQQIQDDIVAHRVCCEKQKKLAERAIKQSGIPKHVLIGNIGTVYPEYIRFLEQLEYPQGNVKVAKSYIYDENKSPYKEAMKHCILQAQQIVMASDLDAIKYVINQLTDACGFNKTARMAAIKMEMEKLNDPASVGPSGFYRVCPTFERALDPVVEHIAEENTPMVKEGRHVKFGADLEKTFVEATAEGFRRATDYISLAPPDKAFSYTTLIGEMKKDLARAEHGTLASRVFAQALVGRLILQDSELMDYPIQEVYKAHANLWRIFPKLMTNDLIAKDLLKRYLAQGGLDPQDINTLARAEKELAVAKREKPLI